MLDIIFFSYSIRWNSPTCSLPQTKKPHPYDFLKSIQNFQPPFQRIAQPSTPSLQGTSLSPCLSLRVLAEAPFSFLQGIYLSHGNYKFQISNFLLRMFPEKTQITEDFDLTTTEFHPQTLF